MKTNATSAGLIEKAKHEGEKEAREAAFSPTTEWLARIGFGVRGLIYLMMGVIALQVAQGARSTTADQQGAIAAIGANPVGHILLIVVMVGLAGYALWGVIRALFDPLHVGNDLNGRVQRLGFLVSAAGYASLILPTYDLLTRRANAASNGSQTLQVRRVVSAIMELPGGHWVVGLLGLVVVGVSLAQVYYGISSKFNEQFRFFEVDHDKLVWIRRLGRFGTIARGIAFAWMGAFIVLAAYQKNPFKAQGIGGTLNSVLYQPYGPWLLSLLAAGLIVFGVFSISGVAWFRLQKAA